MEKRMGKKSKTLWTDVATHMEAIKNDYPRCEELTDYFRDRLAEFLDAPLVGNRRKDIYGQMESVSLRLLPSAEDMVRRIRIVGTDFDTFDRFLKAKTAARRDDWTPLKKKSLEKYLNSMALAKPKLEDMRRLCNPIPQYVKDALAHCKQA
jgi:hypothetical protein